jgi:preprotein translocase subunit SecE
VVRAPARRQARSEQVRRRPGFQFVRETVGELRRVVWPSREQAIRLTILVMVISFTVGVILGVIDVAFGRLFGVLI